MLGNPPPGRARRIDDPDRRPGRGDATTRLLIVEDDPDVRELVCAVFRSSGFAISAASDVRTGTAAVRNMPFDVLILDQNLPDGSGLEVLDLARSFDPVPHVIVLTGATGEEDRAEAMSRGADDYILKPAFLQELAESVRTAQERNAVRRSAPIVVGDLRIDTATKVVTRAGLRIDLTAKELELLRYLADRKGTVLSSDQLLRGVWLTTWRWQQASVVADHIRRLRAKIEDDPKEPTLLTTVHGAGFRLGAPDDS